MLFMINFIARKAGYIGCFGVRGDRRILAIAWRAFARATWLATATPAMRTIVTGHIILLYNRLSNINIWCDWDFVLT